MSSPEDFYSKKKRKISILITPFIKKRVNSELSKMTTTNDIEAGIIKFFKTTPQFKNLLSEMKTIIDSKVNVSYRRKAHDML